MHKEIRYFKRDGVPRVQETVYRQKGDETPLAVGDLMEAGDVELSQEAYERMQDELVDAHEAKNPGVMVAGLHFARAVKRANGVRAKQAKAQAAAEKKAEPAAKAAAAPTEEKSKKRAPRKRAANKKKE